MWSCRAWRTDESGKQSLHASVAAIGSLLILAFEQHKLFIHGHGIMTSSPLVRLLRILRIIRSVAQTLGNGFSPYSCAWEYVWLLPWASVPFAYLYKKKNLRRIISPGPLSCDSSWKDKFQFFSGSILPDRERLPRQTCQKNENGKSKYERRIDPKHAEKSIKIQTPNTRYTSPITIAKRFKARE